ncbi:MAG: rhodanese-like domain-containing protein [Rickettsiaceae bacterium]|nr:rhodanese-like domain-containing protein [Rickettsiaceae bacterium]
MKIITAQELKIRLDKKDSLLIDVREPIEHRNEYIEGTYLIPLGEIALEKLPSTKKTIVLYCKSGNRSSEAYKKLLTQDPKRCITCLGGITA